MNDWETYARERQQLQRRRSIRQLQEYLKEITRLDDQLPWLAVDGIFGPETAQAVRTFQKDAGLEQTGEVDLTTWDRIRQTSELCGALYCPPMPMNAFPDELGYYLDQGGEGKLVVLVQVMLRELAKLYYNIAAVELSGRMDEATCGCLRTVQQIFDLAQDGRLDRWTWDSIIVLSEKVRCGPIRSPGEQQADDSGQAAEA